MTKGHKDENNTQVRLKDLGAQANRKAQADREEALLGSKAGRDRDDRDRAKRPASRAKKLEDSVNANSKKISCK